MNRSRLADVCSRGLFVATIAAALCGLGYAISRQQWFPAPQIERWLSALETTTVPTAARRPHHLHRARYDFTGARTHHADRMSPGLTLVTSYWKSFDWKAGARLIDADGRVRHAWDLNPAEIWPESPHRDHVRGSKNVPGNYIHGSYLFPNGDLMFNIEYLGLARVDAQGKVLWTLPYRTHHSIYRDTDGTFWVCGAKWIDNTDPGRQYLHRHYPELHIPIVEEHALHVDADGNLLDDINITKAVMNHPMRRLIWQCLNTLHGDILHVNNIETLPAAIADSYPLFEAGDILVCARSLHSIFVIDRTTHEVKWHRMEGIFPHDPDFLGDGLIGFFDNHLDHTPYGSSLGGSRIVGIRPGTPGAETLYPPPGKNTFYTPKGGKWQQLPNGNKLITEAQHGRVFEVGPDGTLLWEWVNDRFNDELVPEVLEGTRYPITADDVAAWNT